MIGRNTGREMRYNRAGKKNEICLKNITVERESFWGRLLYSEIYDFTGKCFYRLYASP